MKKTAWILFFVLALHIPVYAGDTEPHRMEWSFLTYESPGFYARQRSLYAPQDITLVETDGNGWGCIDVNGERQWLYLERNIRRITKYMPVYDGKNSQEPAAVIEPQTVEIVMQEDEWALIKTWLGEKWLNFNAASPYVRLDVPNFNQHELGYPTGCEIISAAMMINYVTEAEPDVLVSMMPRSDDPNLGFRGDPATKGGFSVFPGALTGLLREYTGTAYDMTGCLADDLKEKIASGTPVVVWISGLGFNVHAFCLTGYDEEGFYYNDPWNGKKDRFITYSAFYKVWNTPIYDKRLDKEYEPRKALGFDIKATE